MIPPPCHPELREALRGTSANRGFSRGTLVETKGPRREGDDGSGVELLLDEKVGDGERKRRIRCPKCRWMPGAHDRWQCSCLHVWNTFDTRGVCPRCGRQWKETKCLKCKQWSAHEEWYEK